jgi:hypothetical protein
MAIVRESIIAARLGTTMPPRIITIKLSTITLLPSTRQR